MKTKSEIGYERVNDEEGKPKNNYTVQIALYPELLNKLGYEDRLLGKLIVIASNGFDHDLSSPVGKRTTSVAFGKYYEQEKTISTQGLRGTVFQIAISPSSVLNQRWREWEIGGSMNSRVLHFTFLLIV